MSYCVHPYQIAWEIVSDDTTKRFTHKQLIVLCASWENRLRQIATDPDEWTRWKGVALSCKETETLRHD